MPFDGIRNLVLVRTLADVLDDLPDLFQKEDFSLANLPAHIEETVRSLAQLHADHHQNATFHERAVARTTALLAHPRFIGGLVIVVAVWMTLNLLAGPLGYPA